MRDAKESIKTWTPVLDLLERGELSQDELRAIIVCELPRELSDNMTRVARTGIRGDKAGFAEARKLDRLLGKVQRAIAKLL